MTPDPTEEPDDTPTGNLSASPRTIYIGGTRNKTEVKVTSVSPSDLRLKVDYPGDLLTWESSSCGTGGGITPDSAGSQARLVGSRATIGPFGGSNKFKLKACKTGTATLRLLTVSGNTELDTATVRITTETIDPPPSSPSISISDLASSIKVGLNDFFTVSASHLSSSNSYSIRVTTNNSDIGFNNTCSDRQEDVGIPAGRTSYSKSLTLHGCDTTGGTVSAILRRDGTDIAVDSQHVTVTVPEPPTNLSMRYHLIHADRLVVRYDESVSPQRFYEFYIYRSNSEKGVYLHQETEQDDASPVEFSGTGIEHGKWYKAKGRTCNTQNREGCGDWSNESAAFFFDAPPTITSVAVDPDDADKLVVDYTGATSQTGYFRFEVQRSDTPDGTYNVAQTVDDALTPEVEVDGLDHSRWYQFRARSCRAGWVNCTGWSGYTDRVFLLAKPVLDVQPLPLRKARLSWGGVLVPSTHYDEYVVEIQEAGGGWSSARTETLTDAYLDIDLDDMVSGEGLADNGEYEIRVKARQRGSGGGADGMDGGYSDTITIIDNPILTGGRASGNSPGGSGQATFEWDRIPDPTEYIVRYGAILQGFHFGYGAIPPHSDEDWPQYSDWPYVTRPLSTKSVQQPSSGPVSADITGLGQLYTVFGNPMYAIQVNYETANNVRVFSARYAFVWPSGRFPEENARVGTYPFFGHHPNREFKYIICQSQFSSSDWPSWQSIIENAFSQWQEATDGFMTVIRDQSRDCPQDPQGDAERMRRFIFQDDQQSEVRMLDTATTSIWAFPEVKSDVFKGLCVPAAAACITSFPGYSGISHDDERRHELLTLLEDYDLHVTDKIRAFFKLVPGDRKAENELLSVDVTFNYRSNRDSDGDGVNDARFRPGHLNQPNSVSFNTCLDSSGNSASPNPDTGYYAYRVAVHEAGHALGLANITLNPLQIAQPYHVAHPTIPDSAMNYDTDVPQEWARWVPSPLVEPDCSPHPFDIMAIYALYQTVPRVSISGPTSQRERTWVNLTVDHISNLVSPYTYEWSAEPWDLTFSPRNTSRSVSITLPDVDASDPVEQRSVVVEVKVTDTNGKVGRRQHVITVNP